MTPTAGENMNGFGTPLMYLDLAQDLLSICTQLAASAGKAISARVNHSLLREDWMSCLEQALRLQNYAPSTVQKYCICVDRFLRDEKWTRPSDLNQAQVRRHLSRLQEEGLGNGSLRLHLCAIRTVFDRLLGKNITEGIDHAPRPSRRPVATEEQVRALLKTSQAREKLIILLLNKGKLLPGEISVLSFIQARRVSTHDDKHTAPVSRRRDAQSFMLTPQSRDTDKHHSTWLFPSPSNSGPISLRTLQRRIKRIAETAGMKLNCTAIRLAPTVTWPQTA